MQVWIGRSFREVRPYRGGVVSLIFTPGGCYGSMLETLREESLKFGPDCRIRFVLGMSRFVETSSDEWVQLGVDVYLKNVVSVT